MELALAEPTMIVTAGAPATIRVERNPTWPQDDEAYQALVDKHRRGAMVVYPWVCLDSLKCFMLRVLSDCRVDLGCASCWRFRRRNRCFGSSTHRWNNAFSTADAEAPSQEPNTAHERKGVR